MTQPCCRVNYKPSLYSTSTKAPYSALIPTMQWEAWNVDVSLWDYGKSTG